MQAERFKVREDKLSRAWYVVLLVYIVLFLGTGHLTFFHNNEYATTPANMKKITRGYGDQGKNEMVEKLIKLDTKGYNEVSTF
ncbi:MAG: hypothetical protein D3924_15090 [Candidatus Electrothrix sp. AR4]|nr:hypothetical protein [Candidatus Electrothrix sp. AR4]